MKLRLTQWQNGRNGSSVGASANTGPNALYGQRFRQCPARGNAISQHSPVCSAYFGAQTKITYYHPR